MLGRQPFAVFGGAGLEQDRAPLWRAADVQRPLYREEFPLVIESVQFAGAEEFAAGLITHEGVVFPGIPQPFGNVEKLAGDAVTQAVLRVFFAREIFGRAFQRRGHHVPAGAAVAQVIEAGELAGDGERIAVGGGEGAHQADFIGGGGQRGQQGERFETIKKMRNGLFVDI